MELQLIQNKIFEIRGLKVMLDKDLAELYQVETKYLNRAVKRNIERFPERFMFQLTNEEASRFQIGTLNGRGSNLKYLPYAFTEQGVAMLSGVLKSEVAIQVSIGIMDAFVIMRQYLIQATPSMELLELKKQVKILHEDLDSLNKDHENYEQHFDDIYLALAQLAKKQKQNTDRSPIGFKQKNN